MTGIKRESCRGREFFRGLSAKTWSQPRAQMDSREHWAAAIVSLSKTTITVAFAISIGGCVIVPLGSDRASPPTITPVVPAEIKTSNREVMVLAQSWNRGGYVFTNQGDIISGPVFVNGSTLDLAIRQFDMETVLNSFFAWSVGFGTGNMGTSRVIGQRLQRLCIVTADGLQLPVDPWYGKWKAQAPGHLHAARRDAIVSALRGGGDRPFDKVDGPCGVRGTLEWPATARSKAIEFLSRLPRVEPVDVNPQLAAILTRLRTEPVPGGAMLLVAARWSTELVETSPLFLGASDYQEFRAITAFVNARDIVMLLPTMLSRYSTGQRALEELKVDTLCAVGGNGDVRSWSERMDTWTQPDSVPPHPEWRKEVLARLNNEPTFHVWDENCVPTKPKIWQAAQLQSAVAFLTALPVQAQPLPGKPVALESMLALPVAIDAASAAGLVLFVSAGTEKQAGTYPLFLRPGNEHSALVRTVASMPPADLLSVLRRIDPQANSVNLDHVCLFASDGQFVDLESESTKSWKDPGHERPTVTASFRDAALAALSDDKRSYDGSYVCSLEVARWPQEVREKVLAFLERMPAVPGIWRYYR
jgi:hypothetical protein